MVSVLHGLGNRIAVLEETNQLGNYLLFTWITVFFFNMAIPVGKVAVAAFLIEMNSGGSTFPMTPLSPGLSNTSFPPSQRSQNPQESNSCGCIKYHPQHPAGHPCLVPMQPSKCALGPLTTEPMQPHYECSLQLFRWRLGGNLGLLSGDHSRYDAGSIAD